MWPGTVSLELLTEPSLTVLGVMACGGRVFKGRGTPPSCGRTEVGAARASGVGGMQKPGMVSEHVAAPCSEELGGRPGASPLGQTPSFPVEHPASAACFLVWVLGADSHAQCPVIRSPPSLTSPVAISLVFAIMWLLALHGASSSPQRSAQPLLRVVPGSWTGLLSSGQPPFHKCCSFCRSNCLEGSRLPLTCFCLGSCSPWNPFDALDHPRCSPDPKWELPLSISLPHILHRGSFSSFTPDMS